MREEKGREKEEDVSAKARVRRTLSYKLTVLSEASLGVLGVFGDEVGRVLGDASEARRALEESGSRERPPTHALHAPRPVCTHPAPVPHLPTPQPFFSPLPKFSDSLVSVPGNASRSRWRRTRCPLSPSTTLESMVKATAVGARRPCARPTLTRWLACLASGSATSRCLVWRALRRAGRPSHRRAGAGAACHRARQRKGRPALGPAVRLCLRIAQGFEVAWADPACVPFAFIARTYPTMEELAHHLKEILTFFKYGVVSSCAPRVGQHALTDITLASFLTMDSVARAIFMGVGAGANIVLRYAVRRTAASLSRRAAATPHHAHPALREIHAGPLPARGRRRGPHRPERRGRGLDGVGHAAGAFSYPSPRSGACPDPTRLRAFFQ